MSPGMSAAPRERLLRGRRGHTGAPGTGGGQGRGPTDHDRGRAGSWVTAARAIAAALWLGAAACGGSGSPPAARPAGPPGQVSSPPSEIDTCRPAYDEYERRWRIALTEDLREVSDSMEPAEIEDIVASQLTTLPNHDELTKLRTVYAVVELFLVEAPWPAAFAAADRAIEQCGESARRPT